MLVLAGVGIAALAAWKYATRVKAPNLSDYNILLISLDTARADFFGCYGNGAASTPAMDALASQGVLFENFYTNINATLPAHSSIMTGLYPAHHGVARNSMRLAETNLTLAEFLAEKNYKTAAFIGSFILSSTFGFHQGFQTFDEKFDMIPSDYVEHQIQIGSSKKSDMIVHKNNIRQITRRAEDVNEAFFRWLGRNQDEKFFAFVHYYDPHFPYVAPERWHKKHLSSIPPGTPLTQQDRNPLEKTFQKKIDPNLTFRASDIHRLKYTREIDVLLKLYLSEIEYTDYAIGQLMERLEKTNLRSKTIIIVTADHGENLVEHWDMNKFFGHGFLTFETETRVPFVISLPGVIPTEKRVRQIASHVDILPTLANLIGETSPSRIDGVSLVPDLLGDRAQLRRPIYSEACMPYLDWQNEAPKVGWLNERNSASIRWGDYKYVNMPLRKYEAVFQVAKDRAEQINVLPELGIQKPEVLTALRNGLLDWRKKVSTGNIDATFRISEEDQEKLEALGYLQ